jgi:predicted dehydrogenase
VVSKRNHLLAVASRTQETADRSAREWKIPRAHGSYETLLADPEIDVIYNSLPHRLHAEWTVKAVEAGKHVLCEKPLALSVDEVDARQEAARNHGRVVAEAFIYRHHPQTLKVQEFVRSGSLGTLKLIRGSFSFVLTREEMSASTTAWEAEVFGMSAAIPSVTRGRSRGRLRLKFSAGRWRVLQESMSHSLGRCDLIMRSRRYSTVAL